MVCVRRRLRLRPDHPRSRRRSQRCWCGCAWTAALTTRA